MVSKEQLAFQFDETKPKTRTRIQELDIPALQEELQNLAGAMKVKVKEKRNQNARVAFHESDTKILIIINTKKIRTEKQLNEVLDFCRHGVMPFN